MDSVITSKNLKKATRQNSKHLLRKLTLLNKWCKSLPSMSWGVIYSLKVHTKGINQFLYGVQPDLHKVKNEKIRLKQLHPEWTEEDVDMEIFVENEFNTVFGDHMTTMLVCKATNHLNPKGSILHVAWTDPHLRQFVWDIASIVHCKPLAKQMFVKTEYNQLVCLYTIRECLRLFLSLPRNNIDMVLKHGGAKVPKTVPSTILHKSFLSTDYFPAHESLWTMGNKHVIYVPGDAQIPLLFIEACIHGEEHEIMLPPGVLLHYTSIRNETDDKIILGATASMLDKYWIGIDGLSQTKPTSGPYIMVDWNKGHMVDTLPKHKLPTSFDEFEKCASHVFPSDCRLSKTGVTGGHKVKNILQLVYHAIK